MKKCPKCWQTKPVSEYHRDKARRDGLKVYCKTCRAIQNKQYCEANREKVAERKKRWKEANRERYTTQQKRWKEANKKYVFERDQSYRRVNREKIAARMNIYSRERYHADPTFKLVKMFRTRFLQWFKRNGTEKTSSLPQIIGCTPQELRDHIEAQFQPGMSWENHGYGEGCWHVDHIVPLASAGDDEAAMLKLWHYSNLQPMWHEKNLSKGSEIIDTGFRVVYNKVVG